MATLIASGNIAFTAGDDLTTVKKTSAITRPSFAKPKDEVYKLIIDKPTEDTAGDLSVYIYDVDKTDGTNSRDSTFIDTMTVSLVSGAATYESFLIEGMFVNSENQAKIGMKFATDSGAITVYYRLYRLD